MPDAPATPTTSSTTPPAAPASSTAYTDVRLRELLGLEADADVDAALRNLTTTPPATPAAPSPATGDPAAPAPTTPASPAPATPAGELVGSGAVATLSAGQLAELQRDAAWARDRRRAEVLDAAVTTGRITPAERGYLTSELAAAPAGTRVTGFAAALERDEDGTTVLLNTLAPRFATSELGSGDAPTATADKAFDDFEASTFGLDRSAPAS